MASKHLIVVKNPLACIAPHISAGEAKILVNKVGFNLTSCMTKQSFAAKPISSPIFRCLTCVGFYCSVYRVLSEIFYDLDKGPEWVRSLVWDQLFVLVGEDIRGNFTEPLQPYLDHYFNAEKIEPLEFELLLLSTFLVMCTVGDLKDCKDNVPKDKNDRANLLSSSARNFFLLFAETLKRDANAYVNENHEYSTMLTNEAYYGILVHWQSAIDAFDDDQRVALFSACRNAVFLKRFVDGSSFLYVLDMMKNYEEHSEGILLLHQGLSSLYERDIVGKVFSRDYIDEVLVQLYGADSLSASVMHRLATNSKYEDGSRWSSTPAMGNTQSADIRRNLTIGSLARRVEKLNVGDM